MEIRKNKQQHKNKQQQKKSLPLTSVLCLAQHPAGVDAYDHSMRFYKPVFLHRSPGLSTADSQSYIKGYN